MCTSVSDCPGMWCCTASATALVHIIHQVMSSWEWVSVSARTSPQHNVCNLVSNLAIQRFHGVKNANLSNSHLLKEIQTLRTDINTVEEEKKVHDKVQSEFVAALWCTVNWCLLCLVPVISLMTKQTCWVIKSFIDKQQDSTVCFLPDLRTGLG